MSEEEKEAIEIVKEIKDIRGMRQDVEGENEDLEALDTLINLINKQQKEIERLKNFSKTTYISKDKIKEKIEELKNRKIGASTGIFAVQVDILEELLGE